jgi:hypothetical protein
MIPLPIVLACILLFVVFAVTAAQMIVESGRAVAAVGAFCKAASTGAAPVVGDRRLGLRGDQLQAVRTRCRALRGEAAGWWSRVEESIERYPPALEPERYWLTLPAREVLPEEDVTGRMYNGAFYQAVPGILTGLGLLATFISILLALKGLHVSVTNNTETVTGIKELIEGLSGKFVSSIVGLLLSMVFILMERRWCERRIENAWHALIGSVSALLPTLNPVRVQADAQAAAAQSVALLTRIAGSLEGLGDMVSVSHSAVPDAAAELAGDVRLFSAKLRAVGGLLGSDFPHARREGAPRP